jgi:hypothetical protein
MTISSSCFFFFQIPLFTINTVLRGNPPRIKRPNGGVGRVTGVIAKVTLEGYPSCGFNFYIPNKKDDYNDALRYDHALPSPYEETLFAIDTNWDEFLKYDIQYYNDKSDIYYQINFLLYRV